MNDPPDASPRTVGELRRRLVELGNPWQVDPSLADEDLLPTFPRGGQFVEDQGRSTAAVPAPLEGDIADTLRVRPPSNPFLRLRWMELELLPADGDVPLVGSSPDLDDELSE